MTLDELLEQLLYYRGQTDGKTLIKFTKEEPILYTDGTYDEDTERITEDFEPTISYQGGTINFDL